MNIEVSKRNKIKKYNKAVLSYFYKGLLTLIILFSGTVVYSQAWKLLNNLEPNYNMGVMLLLPDGTVIAHNNAGGGEGTGWDKLTPDATGSYQNGTWTSIASMHYDRLFFPTQVFPDGKVLAAGGEYGAGATHGEVYDPVANTWTLTNAVTSNQNIYDGNSQILANGQVLVGVQNGLNPSYNDLLYNLTTNNWTAAPNAPLNHDEAAWLKLPDQSILFVGIASTSSCRYIPATGTWVADANLPVSLYDPYGEEAGAGMMLPNGKAIFFGATGQNAIYTPSGTTSPGTWVAAPNFPKIQGLQTGTVDAPACMEPNGLILCAVSPIGTASNEFNAPTYFVEYNYTTNSFAQVKDTLDGIGYDSLGLNCDFTTMLLLPNGQVLLGINQTNASQYYWVYTPKGSAIPQGKPVLNSIYQTACGNNFYMTGKLFNGISEGAAFGDDWAMSTNWPLVRLTNGSNTYYAKTSNWNRVGAVQTDSLEDTAQFTLPAALPAGTYTLVVVVNGIPSSPYIFSTYGVTASVVSEITCNGANNGDAKATAQGGNLPYTYSWSNGSTSNPTGTVLSAGTYTVTVKDKLGCTTTASVTITQPTVLTATASVTSNVTCGGGSNGALSSTAGGGTTAYTYSWSGGGTNATKTGASAGTYTVTVTDKNGCTATASATITQPTTLTVTANVTSNVSCGGGANGALSTTVAGGTPTYTYAWSGGGTNATKTGLSAGSYTITVTDKNGCTATASAAITQPAMVTNVPSVTANVSCNGGANGSASTTAGGGTAPYAYAWTGGGTNSTKTGLTAGSYTITVTDKNGCATTAAVAITQPAVITPNITATNVLCNGGSTGSLSSAPTGGTSPYTYAWSGGGTNATKTGLSAGSYTLTVTDKNGCTGTASSAITQPTALTATASVTSNVNCNGGATGALSSAAAGGTTAYTYAWSGGGTNATKTGLSVGTYTITVTDKNGCTATASATVTQPTALTVTATTTTNVSCGGGSNGATSAAAAGGTTAYTYAWSGGGTNATKTGLTAGTYTITVTDKNGCTATASTTITQPVAVTNTPSVTTNVLCHGGSNGSASTVAGGGTAPYVYAWTGGGTNSSKTGLSAGAYTITVTDKNGCATTAAVTITQPAILTATTSATSNVSCGGGNNGVATASATGGTTTYTYAWSTGATNASISNLTAGSYTVTVTDKNGCTSTASVSITQPTAITNTPSVINNASCNGSSTGSASTTAGGGTAPYTYAWTGGGTNSNKTGLSAGSYTITVTDKNGCTSTASITITQPTSLSNTTLVTANVTCNGGANGSASATVGGGTAPYVYAWTGGGTNSSKSALSAGTYTVTATDKNGCTLTASATITQPTAISIIQGSLNASVGNCNGTAWVTASGGTSPYSYAWSPGGATTDTIKSLCPGGYCCTVTDNAGCIDSLCLSVVTGIPVIGGSSSTITIYPDPSNGYFTVTGVSKGQIVELYNYIGQQISTIVADDATLHFDIANRPNGVYMVRIITKDGNLVSQGKLLKIN